MNEPTAPKGAFSTKEQHENTFAKEAGITVPEVLIEAVPHEPGCGPFDMYLSPGSQLLDLNFAGRHLVSSSLLLCIMW